MPFFPVFLSVVFVVREQSDNLEAILSDAASCVSALVRDYELIVVANAPSDDSVSVLRSLTSENGLPNLQAFVLTKTVDIDTASWVGLENALGDYVAVLDPLTDDIGFLPAMLEKSVSGIDVVFAQNEQAPPQSLTYRLACAAFHWSYEKLNGIHLAKEAPPYRVLSKQVVNFILQHRQPAMSYRHLPATAGFKRANLKYKAQSKAFRVKRLGESVDLAMRLLVSTTRTPMRLVTCLSVFGAVANLLYSFYVVAIGLFKTDVAPGWVSLSLQQSGMFFLISLVLLVLGEYILHVDSVSDEHPLYHVSHEFTSARMTRCEKLNIEEVAPLPAHVANQPAQRVA